LLNKLLAAALVSVRLFGCQIVAADRILAKDLAAAAPVFSPLDPNLQVGLAPIPGVERIFTSSELAALAKRSGIVLSGPVKPVCFQRPTVLLTKERLLPVLEQAFSGENAAIEILDFSRTPIPEGPLEFRREHLSTTGFWRGRVIASEGGSATIWAKVRVKSANFRTNSTGSLAANQPPAREIERGDRIAVEVDSGAAHLAFEAKAESSGRCGELVLLRNPENGHMFQARVLEKGKAQIQR